MKAIGYQKSLPISDPESLLDLEMPEPLATGRDLLVRVKAVSVNPVDAKQRLRAQPAPGEANILGYD
ncbi:MAG TPA: zinc-binding alcohol dehydrogenase family protein, partial [Chthoniobacterales bacterium]